MERTIRNNGEPKRRGKTESDRERKREKRVVTKQKS